MRVHNAMALALVDATAKAFKTHGDTPKNWVARAVAEKVDHQPNAGTKTVKDINVHCRQRTREHIAATCGVDVYK